MHLSPLSSTALHNPFQNNLDFTEYFMDCGNPGISVFKINQLEPRVELKFNGEFCIGDCYLVLYSKEEGKDLIHVIYTWIGTMAQLDKRFCCAMYAVGLKDFLNGNTQIVKVDPEEESLAFKKL